MNDWMYAQVDPSDQLARLHHFSMKKAGPGGGEVELLITVREYVTPKDPAMKFHAEADKPVNQRTAAFVPIGWGMTLLEALGECVKAARRFPYEG